MLTYERYLQGVNVDAHEILSFTINRAKEQKWHVKYIYILYYLIIHDIVPHFNFKKKFCTRGTKCVPFVITYIHTLFYKIHTCLPLNVYELAILSLNETWILPAPTATGLSPAKTKLRLNLVSIVASLPSLLKSIHSFQRPYLLPSVQLIMHFDVD